MTTRRKEKIKRKVQERKVLEEKISRRAWGQGIKDDGRHFRIRNQKSPSKRERKKLEKLEKIIKS